VHNTHRREQQQSTMQRRKDTWRTEVLYSHNNNTLLCPCTLHCILYSQKNKSQNPLKIYHVAKGCWKFQTV